jgi:hypothetical protein
MLNDHEIRPLTSDLLQDESLDVVTAGNPGFPDLPLGTNINISPWSNRAWSLVGATGTLPR